MVNEYIMITNSQSLDMRNSLDMEKRRGTLRPFSCFPDWNNGIIRYIGHESQILMIVYQHNDKYNFYEFKYAIVNKSMGIGG